MSQIFNGIYGGSLSPFGSVALPNCSVVPINSTNLGTGDHLLYTVPAGKKAFAFLTLHNPNGAGNIVFTSTVSFDSGSTYKSLNGPVTVAAGASSTLACGYIYAAGDVIGVNTTTTSAANVMGIVYLLDSSSPLKSVNLTSFSDGNNTLYTCPAGKTAFLGFGYGIAMSGNANASRVFVQTTATIAVKVHFVQTGGTPGSTNQVYNNAAQTQAGGPNGATGLWAMTAGDFINVNVATGASTQFAYATVYES